MSISKEKQLMRFNSNYTVTKNDCWEWNKSKFRFGHGKFKMYGEQLAHRVSFILHYGPIPEGACICHKCDNPPCVNPEHLFLGTLGDNNTDRNKKGRTIIHNTNRTHCKRGHEFNNKNTTIRKNGTRLCRICNNMKTLERYHKRKLSE